MSVSALVVLPLIVLEQPAAVVLLGCSSCTPIGTTAVQVRTKDARSGALLCDARVVATVAGRPPEPLALVPSASNGTQVSECFYFGGSTEGTYRLEATHPRYLPATVDGVEVEQDHCGHLKGGGGVMLMMLPDPNADGGALGDGSAVGDGG